MKKILSQLEINKFNQDGAIFLKNKFDVSWVNKLKKGIERDIKNPSPRFKSHTVKKMFQLTWKTIGRGILFLNLKILFLIHLMHKLLQN